MGAWGVSDKWQIHQIWTKWGHSLDCPCWCCKLMHQVSGFHWDVVQWYLCRRSLSWAVIHNGVVNHNISVSGFGTACTSGLHIPSNNSMPKDSEKHPVVISLSTCSFKNSLSFSVFGGQYDPSQDFGYPSFIVSANSQNPSHKPMRMVELSQTQRRNAQKSRGRGKG